MKLAEMWLSPADGRSRQPVHRSSSAVSRPPVRPRRGAEPPDSFRPLSGDLRRLWRPVDPPCIRGRLKARPGIAASRVDEGGSLRTHRNTNRPGVRFRALDIDGTLELRLV